MNLNASAKIGLLLGSLSVCLVGYAEGRSGAAPRQSAARQAPPPFQAHTPGPHPRGPTVPQHQVRILAPRPVVHTRSGWQHWDHSEFARPIYYWTWGDVHNVTCVAEDSYGDQYPVSEAASVGFGLSNMDDVENDALDRCYSESGHDTTCVLATCSHS